MDPPERPVNTAMILQLLAQGYSADQIARQLDTTRAVLVRQLLALHQRWQVPDTRTAIVKALQAGVIH